LSRSEQVALGGLFAFTLSALFGYWAFALHPEWLPQTESALTFYSISFRFFAQLQIAVAAVALTVPLVKRMRAGWVAGFVAVFVVSFLSEFMGTGYGIPFGGYSYTALLGVQLGGRVPALIPVSWFLMALPSYVLARLAMPAQPTWVQLTMAAVLLVIWDLALDPAMSFLTPYWVWEETGPYYGMPWMNLFGWFVTGLVLMALLHRFGGGRWVEAVGGRFSLLYYAGVLLMPLGMLVAAGEWLGVVVTLVALALWYGVALGLQVRDSAADQAGTRAEPLAAATPAGD
jgi:putative membrane protein